jgi:hypothetical protein
MRKLTAFRGGAMHAVFIEVDATEENIDAAREFLPNTAVPAARELGATGGYWLAPKEGRGVSVVVYDTEDAARQAAENFRVGEPPMPNAPPGVTVKTVEVREVLAALT